jgi:hypothetical protein
MQVGGDNVTINQSLFEISDFVKKEAAHFQASTFVFVK